MISDLFICKPDPNILYYIDMKFFAGNPYIAILFTGFKHHYQVQKPRSDSQVYNKPFSLCHTGNNGIWKHGINFVLPWFLILFIGWLLLRLLCLCGRPLTTGDNSWEISTKASLFPLQVLDQYYEPISYLVYLCAILFGLLILVPFGDLK